MPDTRQTTVRFSEDMYGRLEQAGEATGLPINSIVVVACLDWLRAHQPEAWAAVKREPVKLGGLYPFDRFTVSAQGALKLAQEAVNRARHMYVGTEHLALGLLGERECMAARTLRALGTDLEKVRTMLEAVTPPTEVVSYFGTRGLQPVPTSRLKRAIEFAFDEASKAKSLSVGTGHLLLGILVLGEGPAATLLTRIFELTVEQVRAEMGQLPAEA